MLAHDPGMAGWQALDEDRPMRGVEDEGELGVQPGGRGAGGCAGAMGGGAPRLLEHGARTDGGEPLFEVVASLPGVSGDAVHGNGCGMLPSESWPTSCSRVRRPSLRAVSGRLDHVQLRAAGRMHG